MYFNDNSDFMLFSKIHKRLLQHVFEIFFLLIFFVIILEFVLKYLKILQIQNVLEQCWNFIPCFSTEISF